MIGSHNRTIDYLRMSVTDRCNLRCVYCLPCEGITKLRHEDILTYEELLRLARIAIDLGVDKIRLTGGEPLVRKGIYDFISRLTTLPGLRDIPLTTNGLLLKDNAERLASAGVTRLNISLDTLDRKKYAGITLYDGFPMVWEGIELAESLGFQPLKINVVVMKGVNDDELLDFARLSQRRPYHIRFIEYMPLGRPASDAHLKYVPSSIVKSRLSALGKLIPVARAPNDGPAERFHYEKAAGEIGFISPLSNHFCGTCNRLRLTASGRLRPCLLHEEEEDLKRPLRTGASDDELGRLFLKAACSKPHTHPSASEKPLLFSGHMSTIGG
ncbi:MAG: GTP 3',8-cyclase MoaA [Thermodesulfobacteriota bacterium]|nr:GTP 3',8-cyclase MoaA [Thermodesulfobacteriota bacterium]